MDYPEQTALVEMHSVPGDFGYSAEADARIDFYNFQGYPSLFMDGVDLWPISTWRPALINRINTPSPITLTITGNYDPVTDSGTVSASFRNDSTSTITARVYFVITEDSLYHVDPNGHAWHNHLARDFLPDQTGEIVTVDPSQTETVDRNFIIDVSWDENRCHIVTWIQADPPSRNVYQAGEIDVMSLVGVEENVEVEIQSPCVSLVTNPCTSDNVRFALNLPGNTSYRIEIFDILGRQVKTVSGVASKGTEVVAFNFNQDRNSRLNTGIYFYRFSSRAISTTGKIVIR